MSTKVCVEIDSNSGDDDTKLKTYVQTVGDGTATQISIPHNLGTADILYSLRDLVTGALDAYEVAVNASTPNTLSLTFATAPASNSVRVVVLAV